MSLVTLVIPTFTRRCARWSCLAVAVLAATPLAASDADIVAALKVKETTPRQAGLGDRIKVRVDGLAAAIAKDFDPRKLVLYLDGHEMHGVTATPADRANGIVEFTLERTDASRASWTPLLGSPQVATRTTTVSVGLPNEGPVPSTSSFQLIVFRESALVIVSLLLLAAIAGLVILAIKSDILRDSMPPAPAPLARRPYSLARAQMAFWFFIVLGALLLIFVITHDWNALNNQALILIGVGTGTALGAAVIEVNKASDADRDVATLKPEYDKLVAEQNEVQQTVARLGAIAAPTPDQQTQLAAARVALADKTSLITVKGSQLTSAAAQRTKPTSEGFLKDLLTDVNGIAFHRFQIVVWTIVLGFFFVTNVYQDLAMPEFDNTLLALTGISAGTYLGFKIPERQN